MPICFQSLEGNTSLKLAMKNAAPTFKGLLLLVTKNKC